MDQANLQHQQVGAFLTLNLEVHDLLDEYHPRYGFMAVPAPHCDVLYTKGLQMAQLHTQLMDHFSAEGTQLFNVTSKMHYCLHIFQLARHIHPSLTWCFKGEATMKTVQTLWRSCLDAKQHYAVSKVAALKYRHLLHLKATSTSSS
eukprot:Skav225019  [mRNA]  locus=scaffold3954:89250:89687:- [translate_table: standard]